jgi:hemerythrin superfamily protein
MADTPITGLGQTPDAVQLLFDEHQRIRDLLGQFEESRTEAEKKGIADNVVGELQTHCLLEQEFIYPAIRRLSGDETVADLGEQIHGKCERLTEQIAEMDPGQPQFDSLIGQLTSQVNAHIDEEERLYEQLKGLGDEERVAIGQKMLQRRGDALRELAENAPAPSTNPGTPH